MSCESKESERVGRNSMSCESKDEGRVCDVDGAERTSVEGSRQCATDARPQCLSLTLCIQRQHLNTFEYCTF